MIQKAIAVLNNLFSLHSSMGNLIVVPTPGLEPGRPYGQGILSPLRLPIPPSGHKIIINIEY